MNATAANIYVVYRSSPDGGREPVSSGGLASRFAGLSLVLGLLVV